jgi:hypothetical protein
MDLIDLLPYVGAGSSAAIPILFWRITYLESKIKEREIDFKKLTIRIDRLYFYLAKTSTDFGNFLNKYNKEFLE